MIDTDKRVLIISHNPLSRVNNNGKTLVSIFKGVPEENIYQIYLNSDIPDYSEDCHYLQLNEKQILTSVLRRKNLCCQEIRPMSDRVSSATIKVGTWGIHTKRLLREGIWKLPLWKAKLNAWLQNKQFDVVFFMAGDGMFAYDVYQFVLNCVVAKGCLFFTDDYIIGKSSSSPVALLRRRLLKRKIRKTLRITKEMYVISDEMKEAYVKLFGVRGYVVRNFSVEKKIRNIEENKRDPAGNLCMVYAGGLHYNRWHVLSRIAGVLQEINRTHDVGCQLKIYSSQNIPSEIIKKLCIVGTSEFCGSASASQIADIYANADILVHVESFDKKAMASTKYSFSTKIPEYLSAGKCVLAVGPDELASMRYLKDFACVVNNDAELYDVLERLIKDRDYREVIKMRCEEGYMKDFSETKQVECLKQILAV